MKKGSKMLIGLGFGIAVIGGVAYLLSIRSQAQAFWVTPSGYTKTVTFLAGFSDMKLSTQVPTGTPVQSVQAFVDGVGGAVHPWDVSTTGYNYIIDFGLAPQTLGVFTVYTLTRLTNGSVLKSDTVIATIISYTPPRLP